MTLHDRIPLSGPVNGQPDCKVRNLVLVERENAPQEFSLTAAKVILVGFTGTTEIELEYAKKYGSPALIDKLRAADYRLVTNKHRGSLNF